MAMTIYCSSDEKWCFAEQTTWGTAVGDSAASVGILTEGFGVNSAINFRNPPRARAQRYPMLADEQADQKGVVYQTEGMGFPVTTDTFDYMLYGILQNIETELPVGDYYAKIFSFPQTQPDFTINEGKFFTLWNQHQGDTVDIDAKMYDAIISELVLSCSPESNEGLLWAQPKFVSRYHSNIASYTGTTTYPTLDATTQKYFYSIYAVQIDGTNVILGNDGIIITIRSNAQKIGLDTSVSDTVFKSFVLPRYDVEVNMSILWDSTARSLMADAKAGNTVPLAIAWKENALINGYISFSIQGKLSMPANINHAIEGNFVPLNIIAGGSYGGTIPFQTTITNPTDRGW